MQNHYNLVYREEEREMIPLCLDEGVGIMPWSPLARGLLAGKRTRTGERASVRAETDGFQDELYGRSEDYDVAEAVEQVASGRGVAPAQVALAWLLLAAERRADRRASRTGHVEDAAAAAELTLTADEIARLEAPYRPNSVRGHT